MIYAGFWRRLGALLLDFVVLLPVTGILYWGSSHHRLFDPYALLPNLAFSLFYNIYLVRQLGGTPGKKLAGIKICKPDGTDIGYREATLRYLPELLMTSLLSVAYAYAALHMTDSEYLSLNVHDQFSRISAMEPIWYGLVNVSCLVWIWSELVAMLRNKKRRALHDFIAGTVVVLREPWLPQPVSSSETLLRERLSRS
jgi:uncharacterized RDD family membrane protein YckC